MPKYPKIPTQGLHWVSSWGLLYVLKCMKQPFFLPPIFKKPQPVDIPNKQ